MEPKTKIIYRRFKEFLIGTWTSEGGNELIFKNIDQLSLDWKINGKEKIKNEFISAESEGDTYFFFIDQLRMFVYHDFEEDENRITIEFKDGLGSIVSEKTMLLKRQSEKRN